MDMDSDDIPLMANTSQILVKHFALDLDVCFDRKTISGSIVLFLQPTVTGEDCKSEAQPSEAHGDQGLKPSVLPTCSSHISVKDTTLCAIEVSDTSEKCDHHSNDQQTFGANSSGISYDKRNHDSSDFVLVLDCCDLSVSKVEEVDFISVPVTEKYMCSPHSCHKFEHQFHDNHQMPPELARPPANQWKDLFYYMQCSLAPGCGELPFVTDSWSLQIVKPGVKMPCAFPSVVRIWYKTTENERSVKWTKDQSGRPCVYTFGSPINNRALFPCQEPTVAMSTWHATVRAVTTFIVLMSGENFASPSNCGQGLNSWFYYVTMPMPASTFTIAVGRWTEVKEIASEKTFNSSPFTALNDNDSRSLRQECKHMEYPCRYSCPEAQAQMCIPYRVFAPDVLSGRCIEWLLPLLPHCLEAAYSVLGVHPFSRLDVLIVPPNFSSLGMASPHIIYLSQSVLSGRKQLCLTRVSHEIAHAWFGLAIGARDWTEEWICEGFATHLEDVFSAKVQKLTDVEAREQHELKALFRWHCLSDELKNSEQELQILRPLGNSTGEVSDSGASVVRHGLNADKAFMQVHYLKGYFLLRYLANIMGQDAYFSFLRKFVNEFHGQLILSQDFLHMLLNHLPEQKKNGLSIELIYKTWLDTSGIPQPLLEEWQTWEDNRLVQQVRTEVSKWTRLNKRIRKNMGRKRHHDEDFNKQVRHRWCELVIKHKHTAAYKNVEIFLLQDQAMGVYLYGELMLNEDARQQELAHRCFAVVRDQMDVSCVKVVGEMLF
ncbi:aminopeptidase O isoform X3 [Pyxicephalus adspersus]|uniref:aminopeptidase O isoform X3 n=1 Tax=Pyxicephalus adspersus TaxID=30357 RepID=UPI003B5944FF